MNYFQVVNWDAFQHYRDRNPPWIKLHNQLLENYEFSCLHDASKAHLLCIWMLASRSNNKIPMNAEWVAGKIGATEKINLNELLDMGFIELIESNQLDTTVEHNGSTTLAKREHDAIPEGETERETEKRERENILFKQFWEIYPGPRKRDKPKATALFNKQNKSTQELIVNHIKHRSVNDPEWTKDNGEYIPGPVPFLRQNGWTDEYRVNELSHFDEKTQKTVTAMREFVDG